MFKVVFGFVRDVLEDRDGENSAIFRIFIATEVVEVELADEFFLSFSERHCSGKVGWVGKKTDAAKEATPVVDCEKSLVTQGG
jgi:hypothetical protein